MSAAQLTERLRALLGGRDPAWLAVPTGLAAAAGALFLLPLSGPMRSMLAVTLFAVSLWITTPVPPWFTALLAVGLIGVTFSSELALVGFQSPATWLIVFGILIGEATRDSGVADLIERTALAGVPDRALGDPVATYRVLLVGLSFAALGFAVLVPSALVRVLILGPILISIGEVFEEERPRMGLFLGPLFATYYGSSGVLTGALPNIVITGIVESTAGLAISWTEWALWLGPVMGIGRTLAVIGLAYALYRPKDPTGSIETRSPDRGERLSGTEKRMLAFLLVGVLVWATDAIHGLHPVYGALLVVLAAFAPRIGVVGMDAAADADYTVIFFMGAIFAIAAGLQQTGFTDLAAQELLAAVPADASLALVLVGVTASALALALLMEGLAVASVLTPTLVSFVEAAGVPLEPVVFVEAIALNTYFFPYQSAVMVAILSLGFVDLKELVRMATLASLATLLILLPIQIALFVVLF
jgi:anion transporter